MNRKGCVPRSKEKIIAQILSSAKEPLIMTQMMYKSRVSSSQLRWYVKYWEDRELIQRLGDRTWVITDLGRQYLDQFHVIEEVMLDRLQLMN